MRWFFWPKQSLLVWIESIVMVAFWYHELFLKIIISLVKTVYLCFYIFTPMCHISDCHVHRIYITYVQRSLYIESLSQINLVSSCVLFPFHYHVGVTNEKETKYVRRLSLFVTAIQYKNSWIQIRIPDLDPLTWLNSDPKHQCWTYGPGSDQQT